MSNSATPPIYGLWDLETRTKPIDYNQKLSHIWAKGLGNFSMGLYRDLEELEFSSQAKQKRSCFMSFLSRAGNMKEL